MNSAGNADRLLKGPKFNPSILQPNRTDAA